MAAYLVLGESHRSGAAFRVQVPAVGRLLVHIQRQNEPPWEDPAQGVVHLKEQQEHLFSRKKNLVAPKPQKPPRSFSSGPLLNPLTSSRASPDLRRFCTL